MNCRIGKTLELIEIILFVLEDKWGIIIPKYTWHYFSISFEMSHLAPGKWKVIRICNETKLFATYIEQNIKFRILMEASSEHLLPPEQLSNSISNNKSVIAALVNSEHRHFPDIRGSLRLCYPRACKGLGLWGWALKYLQPPTTIVEGASACDWWAQHLKMIHSKHCTQLCSEE